MKKGFFFSIDAFMALILFVLIIMLIYTFFIGVGTLRQQYYFSEDLFTVMDNVKINELDEDNYLTLYDIEDLNDNLTIMGQMVTFRVNESYDQAEQLIGTGVLNIEGLVGSYGVSLDIQNKLFGPDTTGTNIVVRQRISSGEARIE